MTIKPHGHLAMIAAIQPVISQGISKTLNVIEKTTVDDIYNIYIDAWKMGLKCVSIYRDGSKNAQPLTTKSAKEQKDIPIPRPARKPLPNDRKSVTHKFSIGNIDGYLTVGMYDDGNPGEIFITMAKIGTFAAGIIDCFATTVSIGLQYGVPLTHFIEKFKGTKFEPSGITQNEEIRFASSVADYVGKWLENKFIKINTDTENKQENNKKTTEQDKNINIDNGSMQYSYNICQCGGLLIRAGTCEICPICGETTGCS